MEDKYLEIKIVKNKKELNNVLKIKELAMKEIIENIYLHKDTCNV